MTTKGKGFEPKGGRARRAAERELNEFLDDWRERVLPNIEQSAAVLVIAPEDKHADLKIAIGRRPDNGRNREIFQGANQGKRPVIVSDLYRDVERVTIEDLTNQ